MKKTKELENEETSVSMDKILKIESLEDAKEFERVASGRKFCKKGTRVQDICEEEVENYICKTRGNLLLRWYLHRKMKKNKEKLLLESRVTSIIRALAVAYIEENDEIDTIEKLIQKVNKMGIPVYTDDYFVKKAEIELEKILRKKTNKNIEKYYDNTENEMPNYTVKKFIELNVEPGNAVELGCGAGRDTVYLIRNGWNVLAIDREDVETRIVSKLLVEELEQFEFFKQRFEDIELENSNLVVANFSLPFCNKNDFKKLWAKINHSILKDGYFVGNFLGDKDEWKIAKEKMTFLTKDQVMELFRNFEIVEFKEVEKDGLTGLGKMKHWHIFNVIAKKK